MVKSFDVVIAGAGPAGCAAAAVLAGAGLSVALLDRAPHPRPKLCGGLLTAKSMDALHRIFGLEEATLQAEGGLFHQTTGYAFLHKGISMLRGKADEPFRLVDRPPFDALLLRTATTRGATALNCTVTGCDPESGLVHTSQGEFQARFIIGADGANSTLRRSLFAAQGNPQAQRKAWQRNLAAAIEIELPPKDFPRPVPVPELHVGQPEAGYGWVFPGPRGPKIGICGLARSNGDFAAIFRDFLRTLGVTNADTLPLHGHPLPYGNALQQPATGRLLLAGDAGGFVEPLFGEGIFYAMATGAHAASAILTATQHTDSPAAAHAEYDRLLNASIRPEILWSNRLRWVLFRALQYLGATPISLFVQTAPAGLAQMVHGRRSFRLLLKKRWVWGAGVGE